jgi:hypothetical protein
VNHIGYYFKTKNTNEVRLSKNAEENTWARGGGNKNRKGKKA